MKYIHIQPSRTVTLKNCYFRVELSHSAGEFPQERLQLALLRCRILAFDGPPPLAPICVAGVLRRLLPLVLKCVQVLLHFFNQLLSTHRRLLPVVLQVLRRLLPFVLQLQLHCLLSVVCLVHVFNQAWELLSTLLHFVHHQQYCLPPLLAHIFKIFVHFCLSVLLNIIWIHCPPINRVRNRG